MAGQGRDENDGRGTSVEVTIHDVARGANVSIATVSRVLNGQNRVSDATKAKVTETAARLGYIPHSGARSLIKRETRTIGVLLPDIFGEFFSELIRGLDRVTRQHDYSLLVTCSHGESRSAAAMLKAMHGKVDGMIVLSSDIELQLDLRRMLRRTPVVFLNQLPGPEAADYESISMDNFGGALAMTRYLIGLGHERIAFLRGPEGNLDARHRLEGYREAMAALGHEPLAELEVPGDFSEEAGFRSVGRILHLEPRPTAIFAGNDDMAIGALRALKEAGVRVPEEISLAGFDDIPIIRHLTPPLTSIRTPISELGGKAAERLLSVLEGEGTVPPQQQMLEVLLVSRGSTAPPPQAARAPKRASASPRTSS